MGFRVTQATNIFFKGGAYRNADPASAAFADNSLRYEAALRFINGRVRTMMTAIRGE